jgi:hypothetical protein
VRGVRVNSATSPMRAPGPIVLIRIVAPGSESTEAVRVPDSTK